KGGDDRHRHEDHIGEFLETRAREIEEHHARHGKPDASPQAEKEMPEPGEHQAQGCRKDRTPHGARSYRRTRVRPVCFRRGTARRAPTSIFCALASRSRASASASAAWGVVRPSARALLKIAWSVSGICLSSRSALARS